MSSQTDAEVQVVNEIEWDPAPVLLPGFDMKDGVVFTTIPVTRNKLVPSKKKGSPPEVVRGLDTLTITSERQSFWFDEEGLSDAGFTMPYHQFQERETRWSYPSVQSFLSGEAKAPDSKSLFEEIRDVYTTYVEFANEQYFDIMALYVMYTYIFRVFDTTGYLHFNGTAASGKSRNLNILNALAFNATMASSMTASALFRKIAGQPGTMCLDESEKFDDERGEALRQILLGGYMKSGKATRSEKSGTSDKWESIEFPTFGPKALASINTLDATFASRCLVIEMRPAIRSIPDFPMFSDKWSQMRDKLYLWMMENADAVSLLAEEWNGARKQKYAPNLISRMWETTKPVIVMADFVGGITMAGKMIEFFSTYFVRQQQALDQTDRIRTTLRALPRLLAKKTEYPGHYYAVKDIYEMIATYMEEDSKEFFKTRHVGKNLDVLGFKVKSRQAGGLRFLITEAQVREEFKQRRVEPFEEDKDWLEGKFDYQHATTLQLGEPEAEPKAESAWDTSGSFPWEIPD